MFCLGGSWKSSAKLRTPATEKVWEPLLYLPDSVEPTMNSTLVALTLPHSKSDQWGYHRQFLEANRELDLTRTDRELGERCYVWGDRCRLKPKWWQYLLLERGQVISVPLSVEARLVQTPFTIFELSQHKVLHVMDPLKCRWYYSINIFSNYYELLSSEMFSYVFLVCLMSR